MRNSRRWQKSLESMKNWLKRLMLKEKQSEVCQACGGDYPSCVTECPLADEVSEVL